MSMSLKGNVQLVCGAQIEINLLALRKNNVSVDEIKTFATKFHGVNAIAEHGKVIITAASLLTLVEFEKKIKEMISEAGESRNSEYTPSLQQKSKLDSAQSLTARFARSQSAPNTYGIGATGEIDTSAPLETMVTPFPQPKDGYTVSENVDNGEHLEYVKRKFGFPEGQVDVSTAKISKYPSFECIIKLPFGPTGLEVDVLLQQVFKSRKLFYVGRNPYGFGLCVQSAYQLLPGNKSEWTVTESTLEDMQTKLQQLLVDLYGETLQDISLSKTAEPCRRQQEPCVVPVVKTVNDTPLKSSLSVENKSNLRFPQPDGLVMNCEFHKKDLSGFKGVGAIHMYFRFDGGRFIDENGKSVQYPSNNKAASLPATAEGRRLYGMVKSAAKDRKLFVVAYKNGEFRIRSKVRLLNSDDYPQEKYLDQLFEELLKLDVHPSYSVPPLPTAVEAHHGESSDDEEEEEKLKTFKRRGPFEQPEKGMMRLEKASSNLRGFAGCGTISVYVRFAGGKLKVKGYKASKSFEILYSQANIVTALPASNDGKRVAAMLQTAFRRRLLFSVEKKDIEPSFRVRPKVDLMSAEEYPGDGYLVKLKRQLMNLNIPDPSDEEVESLLIHDSSSAQHGVGLPLTVSAPVSTSGFDTPALAPQPRQRKVCNNTGARPKQRVRRTRVAGFSSDLQSPNDGGFQPTSVKPTIKSPLKCDEEEDKCSICLGSFAQLPRKKLSCGHEFHQACVDMALKSQTNNTCPYCKQSLNSPSPSPVPNALPQATRFSHTPFHSNPLFGNVAGLGVQHFNLANGHLQQAHRSLPGNTGVIKLHGVMNTSTDGRSLPGYEGCSTIVIHYNIPAGVQQNCHPNPGQRYDGTKRQAYLPDNAEGRDLLKLLTKAFDNGLTFTIGRSQTTGRDNQIVWNDIPHKTNIRGGKQSYGYPDNDYFDDLRSALASKGIQ